jgi:hypothetical protein
MKFAGIKLKKQNVKVEDIEEALQVCYDNISFSTFPYIVYGIKSSNDTLNNYNSGNCIALSLFLKKYLKNIGIHSHLIPASVPKIHMVEGVNHICHVSLLIPYDKDKFYVVDPAFYFLTPLDCQVSNNIIRQADSMDIHKEKITPVNYIIQPADKHNQHKMQVTCYFDEDPEDIWHYYVQEIQLNDADTFVGAKFMEMKPEPFIVKTAFDMETCTVKKIYHVKQRDKAIIIIKHNKEIYAGPITHIPKAIQKELQMKMHKYFTRSFFL